MSTVIPSIRAALLSGRNSVLVPDLLTLSGGLITDVTRLTNTEGDGATVPGGIGVWEATTNFAGNPGFETNTTFWGTDAGATINRVTTDHVFGAACGEVVAPNNSDVYTNVITLTAGQPATASIWVKFPSGQTFWVQLYDGTTTGTTIATGTGAWQRLSATIASVTGTSGTLYIVNKSGSTQTFWVDGAQIEKKLIATPFTLTSRSAGRVQVPVSYAGINATQGWAAFRVKMGWGTASMPGGGTGFRNLFYWGNAVADSYIGFFNEADRKWYIYRYVSSVFYGAASAAQTYVIGDATTVLFTWTATSTAVSINGGTFSTVADTHIPNMSGFSTFNIGVSEVVNNLIDSTVLAAVFGTGAATNADAATIQNLLAIGARPEAYPQSLQVTAAGPLVDSSFYKAA